MSVTNAPINPIYHPLAKGGLIVFAKVYPGSGRFDQYLWIIGEKYRGSHGPMIGGHLTRPS